VAEDSGFIILTGEWVVRQVCADLPARAGRFGPSLETIALNVSVSQVQRSDFAARFRAITTEAGIAVDRLVIRDH
jgi:EAL domain-containing protein (putative c-di-GMP-specific phosphodiesterase class I)